MLGQFDAARASQVELAGNYRVADTKLKPLFGAFYNESRGIGRQRQSNGSTFPHFPVWDIRNPSTWDYNTDFDPAALPFSTAEFAHGPARLADRFLSSISASTKSRNCFSFCAENTAPPSRSSAR